MRSNQQNKRSRGRNNNNNRKNSNPLTRSYESNGPDVRVRGNAAHIAEKYVQLARDANAAGDSVAAENYLQHAEHYFRIISAAQAQQQQQLQAQQEAQQKAQAARAEQQENRRERNRDERDERSSAQKEAGPAEGAGETEGTGGEAKPRRAQRERRPRRKPLGDQGHEGVVKVKGDGPVRGGDANGTEPTPDQGNGAETSGDPARAPQPELGELPAFVTAEVDESAAK